MGAEGVSLGVAAGWDWWMRAGRVEDWRGVPKVQPSHCSPFPLGVPQ
jgi:hypothetical protein